MQHPPRQYAAGPLNSTVKCGQSFSGPAGVDKRHPQSRQHISFAFGQAGPAGQTQRSTRLTDPLIDITNIAQNDRSGLMSHRGLIRAGQLRQNCTRPG